MVRLIVNVEVLRTSFIVLTAVERDLFGSMRRARAAVIYALAVQL